MQYNALESLQAFEAGQGQRKAREQETAMKGLGNALAGGNYKAASAGLFGMGNIEGGLKVAEYGKGLEDAEAEAKRVGLIKTGMGLLQTPAAQREAMRPQLAQTLQQFGVQLDPQQLAQMDLSDEGIRATLTTLQDTDGLMKQYQAMMAPPEEYTLAPGAARYRGGELVAQQPTTPDPFTLSPGQVRYGADGKEVARGPDKTPSNGITIGPDGTIQIGGPAGGMGSIFGKSGDSVGSGAFGDSLEDAGTADNTLALFNRAESILKGGYNSGALAGIKGVGGSIANDLGFKVEGISDDSSVADYEEFSSINKQLAAQMLKLFGGSDTERELAISITSNIGPGMADETNDRMVAAGKQIIERQRSKPEFIAQWTRRFGSLDAINPETGLGFQATWDSFLQDQMSTLTGAASGTRQAGIIQALTPEERAEYEALKAELGAQ